MVEHWAKAFAEADVDTIVGLYAPDAVFMGTVSKAIVTQPEDIKKYFQVALLGNRRFIATLVESNVTPISERVPDYGARQACSNGRREDTRCLWPRYFCRGQA